MAGRDYYEEAHQLAHRLAEEGFGDWGRRLEQAIEEGFTSSEILMALRWHSRELENAGLPLSKETRLHLETLLHGLEEALT